MSFRLDQGHGTCLYRVGVEDDGCHSLLDYEIVAKSCCVLEYLARSLNAVVTERVMIQNEVMATGDGIFAKVTTTRDDGDSDNHERRTREPTVLGDSMGRKQEISPEEWQRIQEGGPTRAELIIQLVQTHVLDPPAVPLSELDNATLLSSSLPGAATGEASPSSKANGHNGAAPHSSSTDETKKPNVGETMSARNIRVAVVGNVDAGKSTLIGVSDDCSL